MHELSLMRSVLERVLTLSETHDGARVTQVTLQVGELRQVVPELLHMAFSSATAGTTAEGAVLICVAVPVKLKCTGCGELYTPKDWSWTCPGCGEVRPELISGEELVIESVELEDARETPHEDTCCRKSA